MGSVAITVGSAATTSSTPTPRLTTRFCGLEWTWRHLLLSASLICWAYCWWIYSDILYGAEFTASFRLGTYLIMSFPLLVLVWVLTYLMTHANSPTNPTTPITSDDMEPFDLTFFIFKVVCCDVPQLVIALFPFLFCLHVDESRMTSFFLVLPFSYIGLVGFILIPVMDFNRTRYWLLLCFLAATVGTPLTGFYPHHARLLKLKLVSAALAFVIAALCGLVYYDHRRCEARLIQERTSQLEAQARAQAQAHSIDSIV